MLGAPPSLHLQSPPITRTGARSLCLLLGPFLVLIAAPMVAFAGGLLLLSLGWTAVWTLAFFLWLVELVFIWNLLRQRLTIDLHLEHARLRLGGRFGHEWAVEDVELIVASRYQSRGGMAFLTALFKGAHLPLNVDAMIATTSRNQPLLGYIRVDGKGHSRRIFLPRDDLESYARELATLCPNASYIDTANNMHLPPSGIPNFAGPRLGLRLARNIALFLTFMALLLGLCAVLCALSHFFDPPQDRAPLVIAEISSGAALGLTAAAWFQWRRWHTQSRALRMLIEHS